MKAFVNKINLKKEIKNPCINRCKYDEKEVCIGCDRTKYEIVNWEKFSENEKASVMKDLIKRTTFFDNSMDHYV